MTGPAIASPRRRRHPARALLAALALWGLAAAPGCGAPEPPPGGPPEGGAPPGEGTAPLKEPGQPLSVEALEGAWLAELRHNGQTGYFGMEYARGKGGSLNAAISVPAIDLWALPLGEVTLQDTAVKVGPFTFTWDASGPRLSGVMPGSLIPVHTIPVSLEPVSRLVRPEPEEEILPSPRPVWTVQAGGPVWAGLEVSGDLLFAGSDDGTLMALEAASGKVLWRHATGGPIRARATARDGSVLVHSDDGTLRRLDASSGDLLWQATLGPPVSRTSYGEAGYRYDSFSAAPAVSGGTVYAAHPSGAVSALDLAGGETAWTFEAGDTVVTTPAVDGGLVFLGCFDGRVIALNARDGSPAWEHDTGAPVTTSPAVHQGSLITGSRSYDLLSLDATSGSPRWTYYMWFSWVESAPVLAGGRIFIGSSDAQKLHALELATGRPVWTFDTGGSAWGRPALAGDTVVIGSAGVSGYIIPHQGSLSAVDRESGAGLWKFASPRPEGARVWGFAASPAAGEGLVFAADLGGTIYAFPPR